MALSECEHENTTLGRNVLVSGASAVWERCDDCGANVSGPGMWRSYSGDVEALPVFDDRRRSRPPCVRCGAWGTELHHWAPRAVFGELEAELWPTAYLCRDCHASWHSAMERSARGEQRRAS